MTDGILAIWFDRNPEKAETFEDWYQHEHLPERLGVPGFRRGRRWETVSGSPAQFTTYETDGPEVLTGGAYLERLNDPTPWSTEIMTTVFRNMNRTVCRVLARHGRMRGGWSVVLRLPAAPEGASDALAELAGSPGIARAEVWEAVPGIAETEESRLRGGDASIAAALSVETLRETDARAALDALRGRFGGEGVIHRLLCEVTDRDFP